MSESELKRPELGDPVAGEVDEDEPDLPAVDEETLDETEVELLTADWPIRAGEASEELLTDDSPGTPDAAGLPELDGYDPETQPEPL